VFRISALRRYVVLGAGLALVLSLNSPASADPAGDKANVDAKIAQTQATLEAATSKAKQAAAAYEAATAALPGAEAALASAKTRLAAARATEREAQQNLSTATANLGVAMAAAAKAAADVAEAERQVAAFSNAAYKGGTLIEFDAILESESPSDLAARLGYLDQISGDRKRALNRLATVKAIAKDRQATAEAARRKSDQARQVATKAVADSLAAATAAEQTAAKLKSLIDQRAQAKATADGERALVLAEYEKLKAESDRIAAELRAQTGQGPSTTAPRPGAFFLMPTKGWKSSDFGMRYDPYYNVWQLHAGTDFAAPAGQAIWAAADGKVVRAGWNGGYGNYTCISHGTYQGQNLSTCYAHQSQILVAAGQFVSRGEIIGRVGTTGASTGEHLHFEVRLNGNPVNPLGWLPACLC
jgi:murein DD-endopeptidase MepM/ murein hydrolase activator NlpD